jgi:hypothetical protein
VLTHGQERLSKPYEKDALAFVSPGHSLDDFYNSSRLDNPVSVSFPIDFKALTFNLLQRPNIYIYSIIMIY